MKKFSITVLACLALLAAIAHAQGAEDGFQTAQVVSIERVAADARHPENADQYKIAMGMGSTIYMGHASGSPAIFIDWSPNKEFPARLNGKVMQVKSPSGQMVDLNITGKKTAK